MTWQALPPLKTGVHQHFMVFDWLTASGNRIFRPAAAMTDSVLAPEILTDFSKQVLTAHLSKHPTKRLTNPNQGKAYGLSLHLAA